jgi:YceI-like domain
MAKLLRNATMVLAASCVLWSSAQALPGKPDKAQIDAGTYQTDASHTLIAWRVDHMGFNDYFGLLGDIKGTLVLDPARPEAAQVTVRIPLGKILTASSALNSELLRAAPPRGKSAAGSKPRYFGPNPGEAVFTSTAVKVGADGTSALIEVPPGDDRCQIRGRGQEPLHRQGDDRLPRHRADPALRIRARFRHGAGRR